MNTTFKIRLVATLAITFIALLAWTGTAESQNVRTKIFPLNTPLYSSFVFCPLRKDAIDLVLAGVLESETVLAELLEKKMAEGTCSRTIDSLVYHERVIRLLEKDGASLSVYEVTFDQRTAYVLMKGWVGMLPDSI